MDVRKSAGSNQRAKQNKAINNKIIWDSRNLFSKDKIITNQWAEVNFIETIISTMRNRNIIEYLRKIKP